MIKRIYLLLLVITFVNTLGHAMTFHPSENDLNFNRNLVLKMMNIPVRFKKGYHLFKVEVSLDNRVTSTVETNRSHAVLLFTHDQLRSVYACGLRQFRNVRMTCYYRNASGRVVLSEMYPYSGKGDKRLDAKNSTQFVLGHVGLTPRSMVFRAEDEGRWPVTGLTQYDQLHGSHDSCHRNQL